MALYPHGALNVLQEKKNIQLQIHIIDRIVDKDVFFEKR